MLPAPSIPTQIGRYSIVCELGRGERGTVYLARLEGCGRFERLMAVKVIHPNLARKKTFVAQFLREARVAASIRHPNLVPIYEVGEDDGRHFVAMEYVSGESLAVLFENTWSRGKPLDLELVVHIISIACDALNTARDIVHRDICPQNIMVGYDGSTHLRDFGLAKLPDRPGKRNLKVPYMPPELLRGEKIDRRSDIFSLGVVLWEASVGKRLFEGETNEETTRRVLAGKVRRPSEVRADYPPELEAIVLTALHPVPSLRYQTTREMGRALRGYLGSRGSTISFSEVEALMKSTCSVCFEQRMDMERRAANMTPARSLELVTSLAAAEPVVIEETSDDEIEYLDEEIDPVGLQIVPDPYWSSDPSAPTLEISRESFWPYREWVRIVSRREVQIAGAAIFASSLMALALLLE